MAITRLTALIICSRNDIVVSQGGPNEDGKYTGWVTLGPEDRYRPLLNSEAIYNTPEEAIEAMNKLIDDIRENINIKEEVDKVFRNEDK